MSQMNRVTAGHGSSGNPFNWLGSKSSGRLNAMQQGIASAASQQADQEHDIRRMVTKHVLAKDMHSHVYKGAQGETPITMDYEGIQTGSVKKASKTRAPKAEAPQAAEAPTETKAPEAPAATHSTGQVIATNIPTNPGEWKGGTVQRNPKTKRAEANPAYRDFKTRKQHFDTSIATQTGHFAVKPEIKIPNYARKAMQPKKG